MSKTNHAGAPVASALPVAPSPPHLTTRVAAHTPGPWEVHSSFPWIVVPASDVRKHVGGAADPEVEAQGYCKQIASEAPTEYPEFHRSRVVKGEAEANARLIAAAPELVEALKAALPSLHWANTHGSRCEEDIAKAKAALAKAGAE